MHRIRNVLTNRVLKKWSGLLRIRSCYRNLGDHGTWLPPGQCHLCLYAPLPSVAEHRAHLLMVCVYHAAKQRILLSMVELEGVTRG